MYNGDRATKHQILDQERAKEFSDQRLAAQLIQMLHLESRQLIPARLPTFITHSNFLQLLPRDTQVLIDNDDIMSACWINCVFELFTSGIQSLAYGIISLGSSAS